MHGAVPPIPGEVLNPLNTELNPICHLLTLLEAHHILHISRIRVNHTHDSIAVFTKTRALLLPFLKQKPRTLASQKSAENLDRLYIEINEVQRTELTSYAVRVCVLSNI